LGAGANVRYGLYWRVIGDGPTRPRPRQADEAQEYEALAARGADYLRRELFNGDYFEQHVQWEGLRDTSFVERIAKAADDGSASEMDALLQREGPKYQYGSGCLSDGVIGAWMATLYGVDTPSTARPSASTSGPYFSTTSRTT
jgi:hypothetical protein